MSSVVRAFRFAFRAAILRRFEPGAVAFGPGLLVGLALALAGLTVAVDWAAGGSDAEFQLYGVNYALAWSAAAIALLALLSSRFEWLEETVTAAAVLVVGSVALGAGTLASAAIRSSLPEDGSLVSLLLAVALLALYAIWLVLALRAVFRAWEGPSSRLPALRATAAVAGMFLLTFVLPAWPTFRSGDFERRTANAWEMLANWRESRSDEAEDEPVVDRWAAVELAQPALLEAALHRLAPREPSTGNVFVLGVSGWRGQDVFRKEATGSLAVLAERFGTGGRSLILVNDDATLRTHPIASLANLATALGALGRRMDPERDALLLVLTSHGDRSGFALRHGNMGRVLGPADLRGALDAAGIRNRIVVVSACHSGVFVPALAGDRTAVFTAAAADRSSFGCSSDRDWTYFGQAFFDTALRAGGTLTDAFGRARALIEAWEARDELTPSRPQASVGPGIAARFPDLVGEPMAPEPERQAGAR